VPLKPIILTICALTSLLIPVHHKEPKATASGEGAPVTVVKAPKTVKKLPETKLAEVAPVEPVPVVAAPVAPVVAPAPVTGSVNCGSDAMMAYIYQVESGCRSWAINPGGCIGLGQACPGGKLPCGLYDWACQDAWFRSYAVSAYGSIYNAYIFRQNHNWW
jgi:hypothetical protein